MIWQRFRRPRFNVHFNDGPFLEISRGFGRYRVSMLADDEVAHQVDLPSRHWTKANRRYLTPWQITVETSRGKRLFDHQFETHGRRIRVNIDSKSLGDTLCWLPQIQQFARQHPNSEVFVSQFWPDLFDIAKYPELQFIDPETTVENCYATFCIGYFFDHIDWYHPIDPRQRSLGQVAADILGIEHREIRPFLAPASRIGRTSGRGQVESVRKRVTIATASTAECKHWLFSNGWQTVVDHLNQLDYEVVVVQREETNLRNVTDTTGDRPIVERIGQIADSEFFIGLGSGLSWLAWALHKPVVLISGFSQPWAEFESDCERVINTAVCHGCWNDPELRFDRSDWNWCPRLGDTSRQFECSKSITPDQVIEAIEKIRTS